jgi:hypothetical protein
MTTHHDLLQELRRALRDHRKLSAAAKEAKAVADQIRDDELIPGFAELYRREAAQLGGSTVTVTFEDTDEQGEPVEVLATMNPNRAPQSVLDQGKLRALLGADYHQVCSLQFDQDLAEQEIQANPHGKVAQAVQASMQPKPPATPSPKYTVRRRPSNQQQRQQQLPVPEPTGALGHGLLKLRVPRPKSAT